MQARVDFGFNRAGILKSLESSLTDSQPFPLLDRETLTDDADKGVLETFHLKHLDHLIDIG